jgi:hypothetical protein
MILVEHRSSAWRVDIVPFCCPYCDTMVGGTNVEHADRRGHKLQVICHGCHKTIETIQLVRGDRDEDNHS